MTSISPVQLIEWSTSYLMVSVQHTFFYENDNGALHQGCARLRDAQP
jgi:hypothetical protein